MSLPADPTLVLFLVAISTFNAVLPLWLGLTILLNAERRNWGIWLAGVGMIATGGFFIFHSAILEGSAIPSRQHPWLYLGCVPAVVLPLAWYIATLWFAGFFEKNAGAIRRWHRFGLALAAVLAGGMITALAAWQPWNDIPPRSIAPPTIFFFTSTTPIYIFGAYLLLCLLLAVDALRRLQPTGKPIADLARRRARPWLVATSLVQIVISVVVIDAMASLAEKIAWINADPITGLPGIAYSVAPRSIVDADLVVSILIAISIILIGEAIISYEIFTGKILPRQGLRRHWRNIIIVALGYSGAMTIAVVLHVPQVYTLLGTTIMIAVFYALLNWRSYVERDRYLENLRPFIGSQQLYDRMVNALDDSASDGGVAVPFHALASDVLGARLAYLAPLGALAPMAGPAIAYPRGTSNALPWLADVAATFTSPDVLSLQLDPEHCGGAVWAIPLWSTRGVIGALLLGEKLDGGLYTQEEIEIARASGERLIDLQAGAEMARRLVELQRQRMAESQIVDARTRRVLHDDLLPQIHAIMLAIGGAGDSTEVIGQLTDVHRGISDLLREIPIPAAPALAKLGVLGALRQTIEGELRGAFDDVHWQIAPEAERASAALAPLTAEVLYYAAREAVRNAARYGRRRGTGEPLRLTITAEARGGLVLAVHDNGNGIDPARASDGGSGQGLALHGTMMAVVGGTLAVESEPGRFTRVVLEVGEGKG